MRYSLLNLAHGTLCLILAKLAIIQWFDIGERSAAADIQPNDCCLW